MTRQIRWELIEQNYDMLVKYATAIRVGTASTEAILRRFTRNASHPVYQAMLELGRAQKTIFIARYLPTRPRPTTRNQRSPRATRQRNAGRRDPRGRR
jgi:TnpA family transposase